MYLPKSVNYNSIREIAIRKNIFQECTIYQKGGEYYKSQDYCEA